jgi:hypothetical protein
LFPLPLIGGHPVPVDSDPADGQQGPAQSRSPLTSGSRFKVTRSIGIEGIEQLPSGEQTPVRYFQKIVFDETLRKVGDGGIEEVSRVIESAALHSLDPYAQTMTEQALVPPGTAFRVQHTPYGPALWDDRSGEEIWDTDMISAFAPPMIPRLWPGGELREGQSWSYSGADLVQRIGLIDVLGGELRLTVERLLPEPSTGMLVAQIRGTLKTKVDMDMVVLDFDADVQIDLPVSLPVPFMVKFDGRLSSGVQSSAEIVQPADPVFDAKGTVLQIVQPSEKVLAAVGLPARGHAERPLSGSVAHSDTDRATQLDTMTSRKREHGRPGTSPGTTNAQAPVYRYRLYEDRTERAFTVLVPDGWQTEGGIMRIPPNQVQTIIDGCGKKLHFSMHDPSSKAFITYFPTEIYHSSLPGTSVMSFYPGQVVNGMKQMPQLLSPSQYVRHIVFPSSRAGASNIEWGETKSLTELANAWNHAFHSEDPVPPRVVAESVEVAYDRQGIRYGELWTALITSTTVQTSTVWLPDFVVVAGGPLDHVERFAPVLKAVITSFRMSPGWMARTIKHFNVCTQKVGAAQQEVRDLERKITDRLMKVQREMQRIDNDIVRNRDHTRSVIQEHEHNVLMGEDKYEDTGTGKRYLIDMGYERNFTDGEVIIQTNDWLYEPPPEFRDMRNINITDE